MFFVSILRMHISIRVSFFRVSKYRRIENQFSKQKSVLCQSKNFIKAFLINNATKTVEPFGKVFCKNIFRLREAKSMVSFLSRGQRF